MNDLVFWVAAGIISIAVLLMVAAPMLRAGQRIGRANRARYDLAVFQDQLAEVDRDLEVGRLNESEAAAARAEIERRMLRAVDAEIDGGVTEAGEPTSSRGGAAFALALGVVTVIASVGLYLNVGQPGVDDMPIATRADLQDGGGAMAAAPSGEDSRAMVARLRERLRSDPGDERAWTSLARTYRLMGDHTEAVQAFQRALELLGDRAPLELVRRLLNAPQSEAAWLRVVLDARTSDIALLASVGRGTRLRERLKRRHRGTGSTRSGGSSKGSGAGESGRSGGGGK